VIYKDKVIMGIAGGEYGIRGFRFRLQRQRRQDGVALAHDPVAGRRRARRHQGLGRRLCREGRRHQPLNRDIAGEKAAAAQYKDSWMRGGAGNWMSDTIDVKRGVIYATTGNPSPTSTGRTGPANNRWSDSLVAIDAETGKLKWAYQYVPHDVWDLDSVSPPVLADVKGADGKTVAGVIHGGKTGFVYVHDRDTGKLIRRSAPMVPHENLFALPTEGKGTRMLPGANGGVEWSPCAMNPKTRLFYCVNLHQPMDYIVKHEAWDDYRTRYSKAPNMWLGGAFVARESEPQSGNVTAVNVDTGKIAWQAKTRSR